MEHTNSPSASTASTDTWESVYSLSLSSLIDYQETTTLGLHEALFRSSENPIWETPVVDQDKKETTLMMRNIPVMYTKSMLLADFEARGVMADIDFFYMPIDMRYQCNVGYCFVNITSAEGVARFHAAFKGTKLTQIASKKSAEICVGRMQGWHANVEAYRNNAVMELPEQYQPIVFRNGHKIPFPPPNKPPSEWYHEKKGVSNRKVGANVYRTTLKTPLLGDVIMQAV